MLKETLEESKRTSWDKLAGFSLAAFHQ